MPQMQSQDTILDNNPQEKKNITTFRKLKLDSKFTQIPNSFIQDNSLPMDSRFLLVYLWSLPEEVLNKETGKWEPWVVYHSFIMREQKIGEVALNRMINNLIDAGYMKRERKPGVKGQFGRYEYVFSYFKEFLPNDKTQPGLPSLENQALYNTVPKNNIQKKTAAIDKVGPSLVSSPKSAPFAAASSVEEVRTAIAKVVAKASPMSVERQSSTLINSGALATIDIPTTEKEWLLNRYSLPAIELSIAWATHPTTQIKTTLIKAIKWFLSLDEKSRPETPQQKETNIERNKTIAQNLDEYARSKDYQILALNKHVIVESKTGQGQAIEIEYDKEDFEKILENAIRGKRFVDIRKQCHQISSSV
jgi:hypothetical protein